MRAIWTGAISFGLVNIPVKLYSPAKERELSFNLLDKKDYSPIRFARVRKTDGKEVDYKDLIRGFEYQKGNYVILSDEDFKSAASERKLKTIEIFEFVAVKNIDPIYYEKPYYLEPAKGAEKPYVLLREALKESDKAGIARFVLRTKEHIAALKPEGNVLLLDQLRFENEIEKPDQIKVPSLPVDDKEKDLAMALIDQLAGAFQPQKYKDEYTDKLLGIISRKAEGRPIQKPQEEMPRATPVPDLMKILRASLEQARQQEAAAKS